MTARSASISGFRAPGAATPSRDREPTLRHGLGSERRGFGGVRLLILSLFLCGLTGCAGGMKDIDRRVDRLMDESSGEIGGGASSPSIGRPGRPAQLEARREQIHNQRLPTVNPAAEQLDFTRRHESDELLGRLESHAYDAAPPEGAVHMDLSGALLYASGFSREFRFAEEEYVLTALRLLIERHLWGPRFFNDTSVRVVGDGDDGFFDTSLRIVNEFRVTQRLPYGGEISARALARAADDLHSRVSGPTTQSAEVLLSANIPLLRGAGETARAARVQAERDVIYAARAFEHFRREFLFGVTRDFLNLVVQQLAIENAQRQLESFEWLERRSEAFVEDGRESPIDLARARQDALFARDRLSQQQETYRLAVDRFKLRIGMPVDQELVIVRSDPGLPVPQVSLAEAVEAAVAYRLDLQNRRDQMDDARRGVLVAKNLLLPDLDVFASVGVPTPAGRDRGGVDLRPGDASFEAGVTFGLPLDREIERIGVRQSQIRLERAIRDYERFRDSLVIETRSAVRDIERAMLSLRIQEENVRVAELGQDFILADPSRATARDRSEAVDRLLRARDDRDRAFRDLQIAILQYLLQSGQLRVMPDGMIQPLRGMELHAPPSGVPGGTESPAAPGAAGLPGAPETPEVGRDLTRAAEPGVPVPVEG